jgi:hypothetical protein
MKHKLIYFLPLFLAFTIGCSNKAQVVPFPSGTFAGQFTRLHLNKNGKVDTAYANLILTIQSATTAYAVTGDTSTIHAGSKGYYQFSSSLIAFSDQTFPTIGVPLKIHLAGTYQYTYDGLNFQIVGSTDSLGLIYNLKKTN